MSRRLPSNSSTLSCSDYALVDASKILKTHCFHRILHFITITHPGVGATIFIFNTTNVFVRVSRVVSLHARTPSQKVSPSSPLVPFIPDCIGRLRLHLSLHHQGRGPSHASAIVTVATFLAQGSYACFVDPAILLCDVGMVVGSKSQVEPHAFSLEDEHVMHGSSSPTS